MILKFKEKICDLVKCNTSTIYILSLAFIIIFQIYHYIEFKEKISSFINMGPRFTASNGQDLCERQQIVENLLGLEFKPCIYIIKKE